MALPSRCRWCDRPAVTLVIVPDRSGGSHPQVWPLAATYLCRSHDRVARTLAAADRACRDLGELRPDVIVADLAEVTT